MLQIRLSSVGLMTMARAHTVVVHHLQGCNLFGKCSYRLPLRSQLHKISNPCTTTRVQNLQSIFFRVISITLGSQNRDHHPPCDADHQTIYSWITLLSMILGSLLLITRSQAEEEEKEEGERVTLQKLSDFMRRTQQIKKVFKLALNEEAAKGYNDMGLNLYRLGRYEESLEKHQKALEISKKSLGEDHPSIATDYNNLGSILSRLGRHEESLEKHQKALEISKKALGEDHPDTAICYNNLGLILSELGHNEESLEKHQKALEISQKALGEDHPSMATRYNNLGSILSELGRYEESLEKHQKALEISKKSLGEYHPFTATDYNNLGSVLSLLGRHEESLEKHQKALEISKKALGEDHPDTATDYNNLGSILYKLDRYEESLKKIQKALEIYKKSLGEDHPRTATCHKNIGSNLSRLGRHEEALKYLIRALKTGISNEHNIPSTKTDRYLNDFVKALEKCDDWKICEEAKKEMLPSCTQRWGENHPHIRLLKKACEKEGQ